jgi:hypothetical protein
VIPPEQIEAAHAALMAAGMAADKHPLAATSLSRWRAKRDNAQMCEIVLAAFGLTDAAIYQLMFGDRRR